MIEKLPNSRRAGSTARMRQPIKRWQSSNTKANSASSRRYFNIGFVVLIFFLSSGVPTLLVGLTVYHGQWAAAAIIILTSLMFWKNPKDTFSYSSLLDFAPIVLCAMFFVVSYISNSLIFHYSANNWLLSMYLYVPILIYVTLWRFSVSFDELIVAILIIGAVSALVLVVDHFVHIAKFDNLVRYATFGAGSRRVIFLKNECVLAFLLMISLLYGKFSLIRMVVMAPFAIALLYIITSVFESRLALAATLVSIALFFVMARAKFIKRASVAYIGLSVGIPAAYVFLRKYWEPLLEQDTTSYIKTANVEIRFRSSEYFMSYFSRTSGLGVGAMSISPKNPNFQSAVVPKYYLINDLGIPGSLYQFGYFGLFLTVVISGYVTYIFIKSGRNGNYSLSNESLMIGCFMLGFLLQPLPMNFFTLPWTVMLGGTLIYLARRIPWEIAVQPSSART